MGKAVSNLPCSSSSDVVLSLQKPGKYPPVWDTGRLWVTWCPGSPGLAMFPPPLCLRCSARSALALGQDRPSTP